MVNGIGGEAKSMVRQVLSKNKNAVVENAADCSSMWRVYAKPMYAFNDARWLNCCTKI